MKNYRAACSPEPLPVTTTADDTPELGDSRADSDAGRPEGWQELPTAERGAKLFRIVPRAGGDAQWQVEMTDDRRVACRRFATELRARAWLAMWNQPRFALRVLDAEELNGSLRASFFRSE